MRFLANENFPMGSVRMLRHAGHEVASVIEDSPGAKDREILERAHAEEQIILTFDRDYGELIYRLGLPAPAGLVYLRFDPATPEEPAERLIWLIDQGLIPLAGMVTVVERGRVRQRSLAAT